jgi:hypothetical protein
MARDRRSQVGVRAVCRAALTRPTASTPNVHDDRYTPFSRSDDTDVRGDLGSWSTAARQRDGAKQSRAKISLSSCLEHHADPTP